MKRHAAAQDADRRRKALQAFMESRHLVRTTWAKASDVSETSLRWFMQGKTQSLNDETYRKLAANQHVSVALLRGEEELPRSSPIRSYVGAGAEIIPFDGDPELEHRALPAGLDLGDGYMVKGNSMWPMFQDGDVLYPEKNPGPPERRIGSVVVLQLRDGRRLVKKLIRGGKPKRWTLISVNPSEPALEDQQVVSAAAIPWVNRRM